MEKSSLTSQRHVIVAHVFVIIGSERELCHLAAGSQLICSLCAYYCVGQPWPLMLVEGDIRILKCRQAFACI